MADLEVSEQQQLIDNLKEELARTQ